MRLLPSSKVHCDFDRLPFVQSGNVHDQINDIATVVAIAATPHTARTIARKISPPPIVRINNKTPLLQPATRIRIAPHIKAATSLFRRIAVMLDKALYRAPAITRQRPEIQTFLTPRPL
ncbi:hypothetical protein [Ensifer canadensis]|uniref:hypothetical protein n=1 Tax=Ensifer canadensis TaxID=555315 RepID=UPI0035E3C82C